MEKVDLEQVNSDLQEKMERKENVDFKMVTFSLSGKDYGVDIMNVKEIAKADRFTFVPNAAGFVRGVYNLRGDIIPIVDLRTFFHMTIEPKRQQEDQSENMLILKIEERVYGVVVDKIDKVVGINQDDMQPPHPIFGDINIKYISGVVEKEGLLYIILDMVRIFSPKEQTEDEKHDSADGHKDAYYNKMTASMHHQFDSQFPNFSMMSANESEENISFIKEQLAALRNFYVSPVNEDWVRRRFKNWISCRLPSEIQLKTPGDADAYLETFFSLYNGRFWSDEYALAVKSALPDNSSSSIQVWNIGCGRGYEAYCLVCILKMRYPNARIKVWANDNDVMCISSAPNIIFDIAEIPMFCQSFMVKGSGGFTFGPAVKESIVFEYHDVCNTNSVPDLDIVFVRDTISFFAPKMQEKVIVEISDRLKNNGIVILGQNERMPSGWKLVGREPVSAFAKD
ncbi:MAG: chemotaxis protein CheW [Spirochaetaceae bacterium]|jgi:purine-binding chemotaxis protein CheW|nr:chemotaxis protein CheW [Spirochaetaceae bacterium]